MIFLLDTHVILWAAGEPRKLSAKARALINDPAHQMLVSAVSLWEITIKSALYRDRFAYDPRIIRRALRDHGYGELAITGDHALAIAGLPPIHHDPFDRLLIAQATVEGITLLTADKTVARYPGPIRRI
jgi:PIN domain nuclease of toxin-antitoxin system